MEYVVAGCRSLLVLVFAVSVISKVRGGSAFREFTAATGRLLPRWLPAGRATVVAALTISVEAAVVALLLVPATAVAAVAAGFVVATGLLAAFTAAILLALARGQRTPCRCFGASAQPLGYPQVARNGVLLVVALVGLTGVLSGGAGPGLPGAVLAAIAGAVAGLVAIMADDIAALFRSPMSASPRPTPR